MHPARPGYAPSTARPADALDHYIPTADQVHTLAATLPQRYSAVVCLAAGCGLRAAEITGLELESVDFLRREIDISP
jgi:integrase